MISIIMAAYNAESTIKYAIDSVVNQTYDKWELIVIDDCSRDNTKDIVEQYQNSDNRIRLICNKCNLGVSESRYKGLSLVKGNWIAILDSDDIWQPQKLQKQIELVRDKKARLVFTGSSFIDGNGNILSGYLKAPNTITYEKLLKQNVISNSSVLVQKNIYEKNYSFGDNIHEDFATWLKILKNGVVAYGIDEPLLVYRISKHTKTSNKIKSAKMNWNTYRYVKLNILETIFFECNYIINGVIKYLCIQ